MNESKYNGQEISYVDGTNLLHEGVVIGQSDDGEFTFVRVYDHGDPTQWDIKIRTTIIPAILVNKING